MPAGKSPNNAFNLHKKRMKHVLSDIDGFDLWYGGGVFEYLDNRLSKRYFYWEEINPTYGNQQLYSKGYIDTRGAKWYDRRWGCSRIDVINKVREYYTDGVRAIGAME